MAEHCKADHDFSGHFCINEACPLYGEKGGDNIRLKGHCGTDLSIHEIYCTECTKAFSENHGTPFYKGRLPRSKVIDIVRHLLAGCGVRGTASLVGVHRDTVTRYLRLVAPHVLGVLNSLLVGLRCTEIQMDEFWAFVRKKEKHATTVEKLEKGLGDRWIHLAMDAVSRLIVAWNVDRRTQKATDELVADVAARLENPRDVLFTADQHEPYRIAIERLEKALEGDCQPCVEATAPPPSEPSVEQATPPSSQLGGPTPLPSQPRPGMVLATVKKTYRQGRAVQVERRIDIGTPEDLQQRLNESPVSSKINTSFVERLNNTFRQDGRRVARKTLGFSKEPDLLEAQVVLQVANINLVRPHSSLAIIDVLADGTKKRGQRTPAMAAGLTSSCWTHLELLTYKVPPPRTAPGAIAQVA